MGGASLAKLAGQKVLLTEVLCANRLKPVVLVSET